MGVRGKGRFSKRLFPRKSYTLESALVLLLGGYEKGCTAGSAEFDAGEWDLFKPIFGVGKAGETAEMAESLIGLANAVYRAETDAVNDSPAANVILGCLGELVEKDDWYELRNTYGQAFDFSEQQGPNVDALSKDRLRTLIHDLDVVDRKDRKIISGGKDTVYYVRQEKVLAGRY